jgi:hypothetical protein
VDDGKCAVIPPSSRELIGQSSLLAFGVERLAFDVWPRATASRSLETFQKLDAPAAGQTPNTKHQTPNTKHQTPNTKHQTPNTKHQTPNTKHQTPNAQLQTPNRDITSR